MCVFKAITVQRQGTNSLPAGVAWFFPLNVWQFKAKVEKVVLVHNSFFVCLFFFFDEFGEPASESSASRKKGKKIYFLLSSSFAVQFSLFPYSFFEMKNLSPDFIFNQ